VPRSTARLIQAFAAWTLFIWLTRIWNILGDDERTASFKAVHSILALISVAFAVAALRAVRSSRTAGTRR